jgi:hypothetical protein
MSKLNNLRPFKPGQSGNPAGRKTGSRVKLSEAFLAALCEDFAEHGRETIERVRIDKPDAYLKVIASILPRQIDVKADPFEGVSDEDLVAMIRVTEAAIREVQGQDWLSAPDDDEADEERLQ